MTRAVRDAVAPISVDYVNAAVPGYTVRSSLRNLRERVAALDPDVIVIYHGTNDLSAETRALATEQGLYREAADRESSWLAEHSLLWYLLEKNVRIMNLQREAAEAQGRLSFSAQALGADFRSRMTELVMEAADVAPLVFLVTFSHRLRAGQSPEEKLEAAASALYYMPFMTPDGLISSFERYNEIIRAVAGSTPALLIEGALDIPGDGLHFNDTVHFTDTGSRKMAQRVTRAILEAPAFQRLVQNKQRNLSYYHHPNNRRIVRPSAH